MMDRFNKRWLAVGVLWGVVLVMTGWNMVRISDVQRRRQDLEALKMDMRYLNANRSGIAAVRAQKARLVHRVDSFGLGFLVVENGLKRISREAGMTQMRVEAKTNFQGDRAVPIDVFATGSVTAIVTWLTAVEKEHPYLNLGRVDVTFDEHHRTGRMQASFDYRYAPMSPEGSG